MNQIPWHAFHWSPCLLQASIDARCLDTAIIKSHSQCLLWDSSPFPKGEQLEAGGGEEQGRDVPHSVSSANTTMFFYHWLFNIWRCHPHRESRQARWCVGSVNTFLFILTSTFTCKQCTEEKKKKMISCLSSTGTNINCWFPPSYINITDSRDPCQGCLW